MHAAQQKSKIRLNTVIFKRNWQMKCFCSHRILSICWFETFNYHIIPVSLLSTSVHTLLWLISFILKNILLIIIGLPSLWYIAIFTFPFIENSLKHSILYKDGKDNIYFCWCRLLVPIWHWLYKLWCMTVSHLFCFSHKNRRVSISWKKREQ